MSATATVQCPKYFEQQPVPLTAWPKAHSWRQYQAIVSMTLPHAIGSVEEGNWQKVKLEVPADHVTKGLDDVFVIEDRHVAATFIEEHRLRGLLLQALAPLNAAFGEKTLKALKLVQDDEGFETLFCLVMTAGEMEGARQALRRFDQQWWLAHTRQAKGKLNFDFELI